MNSYNLYYFNADKTDPRIKERWDGDKSSLYRRSKADRSLILSVPGFDTHSVRLIYHYDKDSSWPYRSMVDLEIRGAVPYRQPDLISKLKERSLQSDGLVWYGNPSCLCRYAAKESIETGEDLVNAMLKMMDIFDPVFEEFRQAREEMDKFLAYGNAGTDFDEDGSKQLVPLDYAISKVGKIDYSKLKIPGYQRTYKWGRKNVNQLINDILLIKPGSSYRLGTLVVNNGDVVDGQQRSVTIALLLSQLLKNAEVKALVNENPGYQALYKSMLGFWERVKYKSRAAVSNIRKNLELIKGRNSDLNVDFFRRLVDNCEFVIIYLKSQNEAFQFFDSQNSRGKDLDPHDLLKAFHLREIREISPHDLDNITYWQKLKTEDLESLFLTMYRIKRWSKSLQAREFTKADVDAFKGFSPISETGSAPSVPMFGPAYYLYQRFLNECDSFPFQIEGTVVNGRLFFDMVRHYNACRASLYSAESLQGHPKTQEIVSLLGNYDKRHRLGDTYIRGLFDALMMYYTDKFGTDHIDSVSELFFIYAYGIRLSNSKVSIATVDNEAVTGKMFRAIRDSVGPLDVLAVEVEAVTPEDNCSKALKAKFSSLNKLK